jgi:dephospho-CoA kinase
VRRVLLTGISGTGKSALVRALQDGGRHAVDLDDASWSEWMETPDAATGETVEPGRDWVWREDRVRELLAGEQGSQLIVSGCAANMGGFLPRFACVVLLTAPADVIAARLAARPPDAYGSRPKDAARVLSQLDTVEPLLRRVAHHELDTNRGVAESIAALLSLIE